MTYEFNVYGNIVMQTIIMITSACFWKALYKGQGLVGDVDADSMLTYVVLSSLLSVLLITNVERRIEMSVVKGTVATDMMKPVNIFGIYFAEDIGNILALVFQNMLPILIIGSLMVKVPLMADLRDLPLFLLSAAESFLIIQSAGVTALCIYIPAAAEHIYRERRPGAAAEPDEDPVLMARDTYRAFPLRAEQSYKKGHGAGRIKWEKHTGN